MILRHLVARHGRAVISRSTVTSRCAYATSIDETEIDPARRDKRRPPVIQGHPDDPSSILDTSPLAPTAQTRIIEHELDTSDSSVQALQLEVNSHISARTGGVTSDTVTAWSNRPQIPDLKVENYGDFHKKRNKARQKYRIGTQLTQTYDPSTLLKDPLTADEITLPLLLANQTHLGHHTSLWNPGNSGYIVGVREGIHIISLDITYAYLKRAAKVVHEVARRGGLILFIGTRKGQDEIVVRAAKRSKGYQIFDRWVPGTLTNGQQLLGDCAVKAVNILDEEVHVDGVSLSEGHHTAIRPDLVICFNPLENEVCLRECGIHTVPTIGVIDTDANPSWVTYPIPANDDSHRSIALIAGVLSRAAEQGQELRLQAAREGRFTYDTEPVKKYLADAAMIGRMDVREGDAESENDASG